MDLRKGVQAPSRDPLLRFWPLPRQGQLAQVAVGAPDQSRGFPAAELTELFLRSRREQAFAELLQLGGQDVGIAFDQFGDRANSVFAAFG